MDFTYKLEDIRLIYAFHAFACILVDKKLCTQRCTPKSEGAANFSFYPEVLRCRDHIKLEMNQIVCWALLLRGNNYNFLINLTRIWTEILLRCCQMSMSYFNQSPLRAPARPLEVAENLAALQLQPRAACVSSKHLVRIQ